MTTLAGEVRRWVELAAELGIEDLPLRLVAPPAAGVPAVAKQRQVAKQIASPQQPKTATPIAATDPAATSSQGSTKAPKPASTAARDRPATPTIPPNAAWQRARSLMTNTPVAATLPTPTAEAVAEVAVGRLPRMGEIPAEFLLIPDEGTRNTPTLDDLRSWIGDCRRCRLCERRTQVVFGSGNPQADLMFVGEGPGHEEDKQGLPFVGPAGQMLTKIIAAIGLSRDEVYIANVVKCRPPENRTPQPDEIAICRGFLFRQMAVIRPRVVVALGKPAAETLLGRPISIMAIRGQESDLFGARLMPTFHPAFLLRTPAHKREVWEDMKRVRELLNQGT